MRLRPVMITVGVTVIALFPLAIEGGPPLGATLLRANRRAFGGNLHHAAPGAGDLFHLCARFETGNMA
jgi:hypothetical protein